jgi:rhodanese-related sulfurtransferase
MTGRLIFVLFFSMSLLGKAQDSIPGKYLYPVEGFYIEKNLSINPLILDVRLHRDYVKSRIPGAIPAENSGILLSIADTTDREQSIFIYCESIERSSSAARILLDKGFQHVYVLKGGFLDWVKKAYPVDRKRIRRRRR